MRSKNHNPKPAIPIEGVILSGAVLQAKRRACPEPDGERIFRSSKLSVQYRILLSLLLLTTAALGQGMSKGIMSPPSNVRPPHLQNVGIEQHLDAQVPADLAFTDDAGRLVKLGDYFGKKPLILNLVYYNCTMLCGEALAGLTGAMKMVKFNVGDEFDVLTVSFNPQETPEIAATRTADKQVATGIPTIDSISSFGPQSPPGPSGPASITFAVTIAQKLVSTSGTVTSSPEYTITTVSTATGWQVQNIQLASLGNQ